MSHQENQEKPVIRRTDKEEDEAHFPQQEVCLLKSRQHRENNKGTGPGPNTKNHFPGDFWQ
jgi:hypothetical protein